MSNVLEKTTESEFRLPTSPRRFCITYTGEIVCLTEEQIQKCQEDFHKWLSKIGNSTQVTVF